MPSRFPQKDPFDFASSVPSFDHASSSIQLHDPVLLLALSKRSVFEILLCQGFICVSSAILLAEARRFCDAFIGPARRER